MTFSRVLDACALYVRHGDVLFVGWAVGKRLTSAMVQYGTIP